MPKSRRATTGKSRLVILVPAARSVRLNDHSASEMRNQGCFAVAAGAAAFAGAAARLPSNRRPGGDARHADETAPVGHVLSPADLIRLASIATTLAIGHAAS